MTWILLLAAAVAVNWIGNAFGAWWLTFASGAVLGVLLAKHPRALLAGALAGALGWGLPLLWLSTSQPIGRAAEVISGVLGAGRLGAFPALAVTVLVGLLLGVTGAWVGVAWRKPLPDRQGEPAPARPVRPEESG